MFPFEIWADPQRIHAVVVHLPVAMALLGIPLVYLTAISSSDKETLRWLTLAFYALLIPLALLGQWTGERASDQVPPTLPAAVHDRLEQHEEMAESVWIFAAATAVLLAFSTLKIRWFRMGVMTLAMVASLATGIWVSVTGHLGGDLVYSYGVGTPGKALNRPIEPPPTVEAPPPTPPPTPAPTVTPPAPAPTLPPAEAPAPAVPPAAIPPDATTAPAPETPVPAPTDSGASAVDILNQGLDQQQSTEPVAPPAATTPEAPAPADAAPAPPATEPAPTDAVPAPPTAAEPAPTEATPQAQTSLTPNIRPIVPEEAAKVSFTRDVQPIIAEHCIDCHDKDGPKGDLSLSSVADMLKPGKKSGPGVIPFKPDESSIVQYIRGERQPQMPRKRPPLTEDQLHTIRMWIAAGAVDDSPTEPAPQPGSHSSEQEPIEAGHPSQGTLIAML